MTARDAMLMFLVGSPICLVALVVLGHTGSAWPRRAVVHVARADADHDAGRDVAGAAVASPTAAPAVAPPAAHATSAEATRAVATLVASVRPPRPARAPWAPGDGLRAPIAGGTAPSEATVRKRAWTSFATIADPSQFGRANVDRLERGRPPLRFDPVRDRVEAMQVDVDDVGRARLHWPDADSSTDPFAVTR